MEYLIPGMILTKDVKGLDGGILLEKDTVIGEKEKSLLIDAGIDTVEVKGKDEEEERKLIDQLAQEYVFKFFMYVDPDSELFKELYSIVLDLTKKALNKGWDLPCEKELRAKDVERKKDLFLKDMGSIDDLVNQEISLASFPDVYFKLKEILKRPGSTAKDIADVVSTDVALSTKLLKLVNSPLFATAQKIESIERAVSLIGVEELSNLALGITAIKYFEMIPPELIDMDVFWRHSLSCAIFAKIIASYVKINPEFMFTAGLLHDVGKLILFKHMPYGSVEALIFARENMIPVVEAEDTVLSFNHTDVSRIIMKKWEFPPSLISVVSNHHDPEKAGKDFLVSCLVLQLADNMANAISVASGGMFVVPGMKDELWRSLNIPPKELKVFVDQHNKTLKELLKTVL